MAANDNTERAIGRLEGKMDALIESVKAQGEASSIARARLYERAEKIANDTADVDRRLKSVEETVSVMDPMVKDFDRLRQQGLGILALLGFIWIAVGGLVMQGLGWLWNAAVRAFGGGS